MFKKIIIALSLVAFLAPLPVLSTPLETFLQNPFDSVPHGKIENSFSFKDGIVHISGNVNNALLENFINLDALKIHTVVFNSAGGLTRVASGIAKIIHENDIETMIPEGGRCYSSCTLMFQAGSVRIIHQTAYLMYHVVTVPNPNPEKDGRITTFAGTLKFYLELIKYGFPEKIAYRVNPKLDIFISASVALELGIATVMILNEFIQN